MRGSIEVNQNATKLGKPGGKLTHKSADHTLAVSLFLKDLPPQQRIDCSRSAMKSAITTSNRIKLASNKSRQENPTTFVVISALEIGVCYTSDARYLDGFMIGSGIGLVMRWRTSKTEYLLHTRPPTARSKLFTLTAGLPSLPPARVSSSSRPTTPPRTPSVPLSPALSLPSAKQTPSPSPPTPLCLPFGMESCALTL